MFVVFKRTTTSKMSISDWSSDVCSSDLRDASAASAMFAAIDALPVPVVGRVHGAALGGGAGLAAVCDIVVADDQAIFGFTEVKLGKIGRASCRGRRCRYV